MRAIAILSTILALSGGVAQAAVTAPTSEPLLTDAGKVTLQCVVLSDGALDKCHVDGAATKDLADAALSAIQQLKLDQEMVDAGQMVGKTITIPFEVKLRN